MKHAGSGNTGHFCLRAAGKWWGSKGAGGHVSQHNKKNRQPKRREEDKRLLREPTKTNEAGEGKAQGSTISAPEAMAQPKASHITGAEQGAKVRKDMEGWEVFN